MPIAEAPRARGWHTVLKPAPTGARAAINLCCAVAEPIIEPSVQQGGGYGDRTSDSRHHVSGRGIASVTGTVKPRAPSDPASPMEAWLAAALRFVILVIARGSVAQGFLGRRLGASPPMRMTASWFGSLDPPNTRLWRDWYAHSNAGSPLIVIPTPSSGPPCSELSRYGPASAERVERLVRRPTLTAPARAGFAILRVGTKKQAFRSNKETDQERKKVRRSETA